MIKRIIISILSISLCIGVFSSCKKSCDHEFISSINKEATYESEGIVTYTCKKCFFSYNESTPKLVSDWTYNYFVDSFNDKTNDAYVYGIFYGTFSNSATTNSNLKVKIILDKDKPNLTRIVLYEYGSTVATFLSYEKICLKTKDPNGKISSHTLTYIDGDLYCKDSSLLNDIIATSELSFVITTESEYHTIPDEYHFKSTNKGLIDLFNKT